MALRECPDCHRWTSERAGPNCPDCGRVLEESGVAVRERTERKQRPERQVARRSTQPKRWRSPGLPHNWEDDQKALKASRHVSEQKRAFDLVPPARNESFLLTLTVLLVVAAGLYFWLK